MMTIVEKKALVYDLFMERGKRLQDLAALDAKISRLETEITDSQDTSELVKTDSEKQDNN